MPLATTEPKENHWEEDKPWTPDIYKVFDILEFFIFKSVRTCSVSFP